MNSTAEVGAAWVRIASSVRTRQRTAPCRKEDASRQACTLEAMRTQAGPARPIFIQPPAGSVYPAIKEPADVTDGQSNVVPYTFYLPAVAPLDTPINPTGATEVTNANVPGLKMMIPLGVRLRALGSSANVTHVSITPVPIDRTPAPLPSTVATTMVYTSQPGNSCVLNASNLCITDDSGPKIPVTYPNLGGASPGTSVPLWAFDHNTVSWYQYGLGTVSADGKTIAPNAGVGLRDFSWHFPSLTPGGNSGPNDSCPANRGRRTVDYDGNEDREDDRHLLRWRAGRPLCHPDLHHRPG